MKNLFKRTLLLLMAILMFISPLNGVIAENANEAIVLNSGDTSSENADEAIVLFGEDASSKTSNEVAELKSNPNNTSDAVNRTEDIKFTQEISKGSVKISLMSDIHVLPNELIADNPAYTRAMHADRKLFTQSQGIFDEAIRLAEENDSEIIMIPGDLTKDGEVQSHKYVSEKLEAWKSGREAQGKKAAYFVIPGNHDINNYDGYDFTTYNKDTDTAKLAGLTTHTMFNSMYKSLYEDAELYINSEEYKSYMASHQDVAEGHGSSSYAKHIDLAGSIEGKSGLTVIGIDTSINTADVTPNGEDSHITAGTMGENLYQWAKKQVIEAKKRNDVVFLISHHGYILHFVKEPELLKEYLLNEWDEKCYDGKRPAEAFADLGVSYVFTGHMHAQDIAKLVSRDGNTIYDIETGSTVTYPCPIRHLELNNAIATENPGHDLDVKTELIKNVTYTDSDGSQKNITDLTEFAKGTVINKDLIVGASGALFTSELYKNLSGDLSKSITGLIENEPDPAKRHEKLSAYLWDNLEPVIIPMLAEKVKEMDERNTFEAHIEDNDKLKLNAKIYYKLMGRDREINAKVTITKDNLAKLVEELLTKINNKLKDEDLLKGYVKKLAGPLLKAKVTDKVTVQDLANYAYLSHLAGNEKLSTEIQEAYNKIEKDGALGDILRQVNGPLSEVVDNFVDGLDYDPELVEVLDTSESGKDASLIKMAINMKIGKSVKDTLTKLKFMKFDITADGAKNVLDLDKILAIEAVQGGLSLADKSILDIVDAFTSEDQAAYQEYSYKEDNNTKLSWQASMDPANFTASINGDTISISSGGNDEYTGKLVQDGKDIALDENHSASFAYDKEFTIKLERVLPNGYTLNYTSNNVLIKENTIEPNPTPQPEPNPDKDNTIIIPTYEPDNRDEHNYRPRRPRTEKKEDYKEETKTIETNTKPIEKTKLSPIEVPDKVLPVNFTDIVNERRRDAIINLASRGVLAGIKKDKFMPNTTVTRAMVAAVFMRISRDKFINTNMSAKDIMMKDWYFNSVKWAMTHGIVAGYPDGSFKPMKKVSRQELAVMLEGLLKLYNINMPNTVDVDYSAYSYLPAWSHDAVIDVVRKGLLEVDQDGKLGYDKEVSRTDFAYAIDKIVEFALNN
ncbi:S-layer homology domain-containing protein [Fenollaria timonensis]|uniref:S-layer homology domain-containing protein n=1 Tax=Fenollaria timonensis TaxID=1723384 RepID=UPI00071DF262|nr:S-layer homology domain-containing protein [Fenollaria timonensis]